MKHLLFDGAKQRLLESVDLNGYTSLHHFARIGEADIVATLLAEGASVDRAGPKHASALHFAVAGGRLEAAKVLLRSKAMVEAKDVHGNTPLMWALS